MSENQQSSAVSEGTGVSVQAFTNQFASFSQGLVASMKEVSELADKRASTFLLTLGTVLLILTMFLRLSPAGIELSNLQPSEFITMVIVSTLFVLGGSFLRLYQDHVMGAVGKEMRDTGTKLLERTHEAAISLAQKSMERGPTI
jgi:hypothetical protein